MYGSIKAAELAVTAAESPEGPVMRDRRRFVPFFETAEKYAHDHGLIVGGDAATRLLLGDQPGPSDFFYELYSDNALRDARALTEAFYAQDPDGLGHYAVMMTKEPRKVFEISVDERPLFLVKALAVHRGARAADIIVPSIRPASFARSGKKPLELQCMGPEIQLMDIYAALTDPSRAGEWASLLRAEEKLRALFGKEIREKIAEATTPDEASGGGSAQQPTSTLVNALMREYLSRTGHAVVGTVAVAALQDKNAPTMPRLQVVTANTFREEERAVQRIASRLGFNVQSTKNEPKVPTDDRLRRMTMYVIRPGERREPFLDVYNAGEYQLVAYSGAAAEEKSGGRQAPPRGRRKVRGRKPPLQSNEKEKSPPPADLSQTLPIGSPFTVLRFLLVDAWTIQLLFRMEVTSAQYTRQVLRELVADFEATADAYLQQLRAGDFPSVFPSTYIGRFQDPIIYAKRERHQAAFGRGRQKGRRTYFPPFYPARNAITRDAADDASDEDDS